MTTSARLVAFCLLVASPAPLVFAADAPVVIERAPDADQSAAQAEAASLRRENEQLKSQLAAAAAAKNFSENALQQSTQELATLRAKVARLERPAAEAATQLAAEKARADEAIARLNTLTPAIEKLAQEKAAAEAQLASSRDLDAKLADAQKRLTSLQADNDLLKAAAAEQVRLTAEVEKLRAEKAAVAAQPDFSAKLAQTEEKLATVLRSYSQLQAENEQLKSAAADRATLTAELEKARQEKAAAESRLAAAPPDHSADLTAQLASAENKLSTTLASFTQLQAENEQLKAAAADRATLSAEIEKLRAENSALQARVASAPASEAASAPAANSDDARKLAETEDKLSTVLRSYSLLQREVDQLKADSAATTEKATAAATKSAGESAAQLSALFDELRQTQARATALAAENSQLKTRLALVGPPPGSTLASPVRPGTAQADAALQPTAVAAPADAASAPTAGPRTHVVVAGDNLARIARQYYGNANRWDEILRANRGVIKNENVLPLGATLQIP